MNESFRRLAAVGFLVLVGVFTGCANVATIAKSELKWAIPTSIGGGDKAVAIHTCVPSYALLSLSSEEKNKLQDEPKLIDPAVHCVAGTHEKTAPLLGQEALKQFGLAMLPGVVPALIQADAARSVADKASCGAACAIAGSGGNQSQDVTIQLPACNGNCGN